MKFISDIRSYFGNYSLQSHLKKLRRNKEIYNFETARTAAILFNVEKEEDFTAIKEFKKILEDKKIQVYIIGFVNDKKIPDHFLLRTGYQFFCLKNLNWYYKPNMPYVPEFLIKKYDILFDLSLGFHFPVHYLSSLSHSSYKIGRYNTQTDYDLMIGIRENSSVNYLIEQIIHYLSMIRTKKESLHSNSV